MVLRLGHHISFDFMCGFYYFKYIQFDSSLQATGEMKND